MMTDAYPLPPCPFCAIASKHPPTPPSTYARRDVSSATTTSPATTEANKETAGSKTHLILSTKHVLAFLDIMPLTRGHVLVTTRGHYGNLGEMGVGIGMELGKWLPIVSRVVTRTVMGGSKGADDNNANGTGLDAHWNVVQNNGIRAAQVVPHVHFHVIPRPPLQSSSSSSGDRGGGGGSSVSAALRPSFIMFGRGQRDDLDDDEGEVLAAAMRVEMGREVRRVWEEEGVDLDVNEFESVPGKRQDKL